MSAAKRRCIDPSVLPCSYDHEVESGTAETVLLEEGKRKVVSPTPTPTPPSTLVDPFKNITPPVLFTLANLPQRNPPSTGLGEEFLQLCRWCNKNIPKVSDIFMYGCFGAFCSPQCRQEQIEIDDALRSKSSQKQVRMREGNGMDRNRLKKED